MTYEESLNRIKKNTIPIDWTEADKEHYNNIVTAVEKSIPKKVLDPLGVNIKSGACPNCGARSTEAASSFCRKCGQALDWGDET